MDIRESLEGVGRFAIAMMSIILLTIYFLMKVSLVHIPRLFLAGIDVFIRVFFEMPLNIIFKKFVLSDGENDG